MTKTSTLLFFFLFIASFVRSQDSADSKTLDPVVVTATKYPVRLSETGKMVTVITPQQMDRSMGKSLTQILAEQSGIIINGANSNPGKDKSVFIRGASNDYTLILLDGVPINDPSGPGGAFDLRLFPVEQIDHIEILKGSQSTLYGSDALAGVINIISKKGGPKKIALQGGANYGSFNTFNGNAGVNGSTKSVDYNINYTYSYSDGISEALDTTGKAGFDRDELLRNSFQSSLAFKLGKNLKLSPFYRYTYYRGGFDADAFTDGNNTFGALLNNAGAIANLSLPKGTITANYSYVYAKRLYASDAFTAPFTGTFHTAEAYLTQELGKQLKMLAGFSHQRYRLLDSTLPKRDPQTVISSPYVSFFVQTPAGLNIEAGTRYNHHSEFGGRFTYSFNASYAVNERVKPFATFSSGFKAPTVSELFGPAYLGSNADLKPEFSKNIEAGVKLFAAQKKLQITATGYQRHITNLIAYVGQQLINIDKQKDKGVEVEAAFNPNSRWSFKTSYNYVTGNLYQSRDGKDTSFFNLLRRPRHSVTGNAGFQATGNLYFSVALQSLGNRSDLYFAPPTYASTQVALDAYTLLNAYAEYALAKKKLVFYIDAKNLTDARFTEVYGYQTMGINVTGGFRFNL